MNLTPAYEAWYAKTIAEGEQQGEKKGRLIERYEIVQHMLQRNMSLEQIAEMTGLTLEQIHVLQSEERS